MDAGGDAVLQAVPATSCILVLPSHPGQGCVGCESEEDREAGSHSQELTTQDPATLIGRGHPAQGR